MRAQIRHLKEEGLSLRNTFILMCIVSVGITVVLLYTCYQAFVSFHEMTVASDNYIRLEEDASSLMDASDYLTEQAQRYVTIGSREYLDNYLEEAVVMQRREHAISVMKEMSPDSVALANLEKAMADSEHLVKREAYAMTLMLNAQNDSNIPEQFADITLSEEDLALSGMEKRELAATMLHDETYYEQKNSIRSSLQECIEDLKTVTYDTQRAMEHNMYNDLVAIVVLILFLTMSVLFLLWVTTRLGINPILQAEERIRGDEELPIIGAREFRYLAGTYNKMYNAYKRSIENLSFKASHDELTGVYNRAGFNLIKESVERDSSAFLVFDVDLFKEINDEYGHEIGDRVLQKVANALCANFRVDDYICRLGGDEFVVIMIHIGNNIESMIRAKVDLINKTMADTSDGLPATSVSVGVSIFHGEVPAEEILRKSDEALYEVKRSGRSGVSFIRGDQKTA